MELDYNALLYEKAQTEFAAIVIAMENSTGKEATERAYEKVIKEDFLCCIEEGNLSDKEAKALCQKKYPLDYVYQEWLKTDLSYMEVLRDGLDLASSKAVKEMKISQRDSR